MQSNFCSGITISDELKSKTKDVAYPFLLNLNLPTTKINLLVFVERTLSHLVPKHQVYCFPRVTVLREFFELEFLLFPVFLQSVLGRHGPGQGQPLIFFLPQHLRVRDKCTGDIQI